ncbi:MAG: hypothetical protein H7268_07110, partial [Sandarakinorhabdus sp.]|nr:hypothetical protein [Sandarakinorhabdus sp.]
GFDDGIYAAVRLIRAISGLGGSLTALKDAMPAMVNTPELRFQSSEDRKFVVVEEVLARLRAAGARVDETDGARVTTPDGWWLLRASNTQDVLVARVEARSAEALARLQHDLDAQLALSGVAPTAGGHWCRRAIDASRAGWRLIPRFCCSATRVLEMRCNIRYVAPQQERGASNASRTEYCPEQDRRTRRVEARGRPCSLSGACGRTNTCRCCCGSCRCRKTGARRCQDAGPGSSLRPGPRRCQSAGCRRQAACRQGACRQNTGRQGR